MPSPSPCISVCQMNGATAWCQGCYRTLEEITAWGQGNEAYKQAVWKALPARHAQAQYPQALLNTALMKVCQA